MSVTVESLRAGHETEKFGASAADLENARYGTPEQWGSESGDTITRNLGRGCRVNGEAQEDRFQLNAQLSPGRCAFYSFPPPTFCSVRVVVSGFATLTGSG